MHAGTVSVVWNLGSGVGRVDYHDLHDLHDLQLTDNKWTRINVTRFGALVSLSVQQLESASGPLPIATGRSPGPAQILEVDNNTASALRVSSFRGCVGEAALNDHNIGLWNYVRRQGRCRGCFTSPQAEETSFHFDGSGFSVVHKPLRATATSIVLLFRTLSPSGLLLYLASNATRDFLSMELVEGRFRLTFDLGSGALAMTSRKKYNSGVWTKITLQRSRRKEKEVLEAESRGTASDLNRADLDPIYIGGLPASRPIRRQVLSRSFVGCIKNVEISRSNFDLLQDAYGVKKGCVLEAVRSVSVLKQGYVQLPFASLGHQEWELFLTFSTRNSSGLLLAAFNHTPTTQLVQGGVGVELSLGGGALRQVEVKRQSGWLSDGLEHSVIISRTRNGLVYLLTSSSHMDYATLQVSGGRLLFTLDLGRGPASCISAHPVNDGQWHTVRTEFTKRWVSMAIDGVTSLPVPVRGNQLDVDKTLYLGGLSHSLTWRTTNVSHSLPGCVQAVSLNGVQLETPSSQHNTSSCFTHTQTGSYFNGTGYAALLPEGYKVGADMSVSLEFRTGQSEAVLLGISSSKVDAIGLEIINRKVVFHVNNGAGRVSVQSLSEVCDGVWHRLVATKKKNTLLLSEVKQNSLSSSILFRGCMKKVKLVKGHVTKLLDLSSAFFLSGVTPTSCPSSQRQTG
ncbi:hypothetical protein NHX12_021025 [Muraenolepis orangiensis]|uniref:Laminin G domain-containing protein n=1 Tax=Muraenolepis orangiensis TaxID=630683 RepID=A0A9Q0EPJ5_9TELE|nr:hypothetical protein NHX12_021025 [Muraenolepis orangiensis]